jgi:hypothetical protein
MLIFSVLFDVKNIEVDVSMDGTSNPDVLFVDKPQNWAMAACFAV